VRSRQQRQAGHASITTTHRYLHAQEHHLRAARNEEAYQPDPPDGEKMTYAEAIAEIEEDAEAAKAQAWTEFKECLKSKCDQHLPAGARIP